MSLIRYVTRIHFAERAMEEALPEELMLRGLVAPLIVTDTDSGDALPRLLDCLPLQARPTVLDVDNGRRDGLAALPDTATFDVVLALGGATAIEFARTALRSVGSPFAARARSDGLQTLPSMAIPTLPGCLGLEPAVPLAGTVVRDGPATEYPSQLPCIVFCDPSLMQTAPRPRLAVAGMDALVHCLEALLSTAWNPPADAMAFDGLRRAGIWLETLFSDPHNHDARREVMAAALNGALALQKGLGAIHALSHAAESLGIGALGHGSLHAAFVGPALRFNAPAVPDRIAMAAEALGLAPPMAIASHLTALGQRLGLPISLGRRGVPADEISRMAEVAAEDVANRTNPRLAGPEDYRAMIDAAL